MVGRLTAAFLAGAVLSGSTVSSSADQYQYDPQGRITQVTYSSGGITAYTYDAYGNILTIVSSLSATAVDAPSDARFVFALGQNTPNPGSELLAVRFSIPNRSRAVLRVFDVRGRLVMTPLDATFDPGVYSARIRASSLAGGVYFYRLEAGGKSLSRRFVVLP